MGSEGPGGEAVPLAKVEDPVSIGGDHRGSSPSPLPASGRGRGLGLLVLFDAHALVHRAYHALPPLAVTRTGEPTGAVYGFAQMVLKVLADLKPGYWAAAFDTPPAVRLAQFAEYKATRKPAADDLRVQFPRVHQLADAFRLTSYEAEGHEADDVLGALCLQATHHGLETIIVTGDGDTLQLVSPSVRVMLPKPMRPFSDTLLYDEEMVRQRYGLEPSQIPDFKGLKGDSSDNIPGVPGVGEKTATKLLQQFGSVEGIYQRLEEVTPPKLRELLRQHKEIALKSRWLATIKTDVPATLDLESCRLAPFDRDAVMALFRELEFNTLLPRLSQFGSSSLSPSASSGQALPKGKDKESAVQPSLMPLADGPLSLALSPTQGEGTPAPPSLVEKGPGVGSDYRTLTTLLDLDAAIAEMRSAGQFALDIETSSQHPRQADLVGLSLSAAEGRAYYVPVGHALADQLPLSEALARLKPLLEDPSLPKVGQNAKFDMTVLARYGVVVKNLAFDTMLAAHLLGEKAIGLKALAFNKLNFQMTAITDLIGTGAKQISMAQVPIESAAPYACADADMTFRLKLILEAELRKADLTKVLSDVEMPLLPVLLDMESAGVALDIPFLRGLSEQYGERLGRLEDDIYKWVGHRFNINSTQQLGGVLFDQLALTRGKRTKTGWSTEAAVLEKLKGGHPVIDLLLEHRQLSKLKSTYIDALPALADPETGRVHTTFNQTGAATGRLSSEDPNLQNIPIRTEEGRAVRRAFIAPSGYLLLGADYSQIDLRVLAHLSGDPELVAAFQRDEDIHKATAARVFGVAPEAVTAD